MIAQKVKIVTRHEKTGLMYTKYTCSYYCEYLPYCIRYSQSVSCMRFLTNCCINVTGFAKTVLKGTFCISRNTNLKY